MKNSVDTIIETYEAALAEHRLAFSQGIAAAKLPAIRKANDAIGAARKLAIDELKLPVQAICNDKLIELLRERSVAIAQAKRESDIQKAQTIWTDLEPGDIRRIVAHVCKQNQSTVFPTLDVFSKIVGKVDAKLFAECQHVHAMYIGKWAGWWELSWDMYDTDCELYPIQLVTVSLAATEHTGFASLLTELALFPSNKDAKRNGWAKPLAVGDYFFKKKTYILRIV